MKHLEYLLQKAVCSYISLQYPDVLFLSDTIGNLRLTEPQKARNKQIQKTNFKCPDVIILQPRKGYCGLFLELKTKSPFKKNGVLKASTNNHLLQQQQTMNKLNNKGYLACFAWSFDMSKGIIDDYMKLGV